MHGSTLPSLLLLAALAAPAWAQQAPPASAMPTTLPAWEQLDARQRDELTAPLRERWNAATADERARMQAHARHWAQLPPEQRRMAGHGLRRFERMTPEQRQGMRRLFEGTRGLPRAQRMQAFALFHAMRTMPAAEREALRKAWATMTPAQREQWMREHAPPMPRGRLRGDRPPPPAAD